MNKLFRSEKGDAIILLSILITGIVMLICVVAVESLKSSADIQNVQKKSLNNLYQAEEGIEYSLYTNKQKNENQNFAASVNAKSFDVALFDGDDKKLGADAFQRLIEPIGKSDAVVVSEGGAENDTLKRVVFANIPRRYYDQVALWYINDGCEGIGCSLGTEEITSLGDHVYQVAFKNGTFNEGQTGWEADKIQYRLIFMCMSDSCRIKDLRIGVDCDLTQCETGGFNVAGCLLSPDAPGNTEFFPNKGRSGRVIVSDWVQYKDSNNEISDLRGKKVMVQFTLEDEGGLEKVSELPLSENGEPAMCKKNDDGTWEPVQNERAGLASLEMKKVSKP